MALLYHYLDEATRRWPNKVAIQEPNGSTITYQELNDLANRLRDRLIWLGVKPGDRIGFCITKSIDAVATIYGVMKAGAAYVPVDPSAPSSRSGYILADCAVSVLVVEARFKVELFDQISLHGLRPRLLVLDGSGGGVHLNAALSKEDNQGKAPVRNSVSLQPDDLAYILYTSGSTGRPKGVQLTHRNAVSFVEWCSKTFRPTSEDRFSSHAPFHFDLSILDIFTSNKHGSTLVLIGEELGKRPLELSQLIAETNITIWYSAPSILALMAQLGKLNTHNYDSLRLVLFAGEVFPLTHLRSLVKLLPHPRFYNLYGPTETNVCTFYQVPTPIPEDRTEPMPIGQVCSHLEGVVIDPNNKIVPAGTEGELCIRGAGVTPGYWNLPEQSRNSFVEIGTLPKYYRTGDIVREESDGNLRYLGRKDRMIKKRGFRIELGEIEACLYRHPEIREAAVVAVPDDTLGMKVHAHLACAQGRKLSVIDLKTFCSGHIPVYMIPDVFSFHHSLPKTSTDKVDYQNLRARS